MRLWIGVVLLGSLSCDKVLGLTERPPIADAPRELDADLRPDAVDCATYPGGQPDEDADGFNDFCDNCPTVSTVGQVDGDGDDVGMDCDPDKLNAGDRIAFFSSMLTMEGIELDASVTLAGGKATIKTGKVKVTTPVQKPTFVVAEVSFRTFATNDKVTVEIGDTAKEWSCSVGFGLTECGGGDDCIVARAPTPTSPQAVNFSEPALTARVVMETRGNGFTQCTGVRTNGSIGQSQVGGGDPAQPSGTVAVEAQGELELRNVIIYDRP